MGYGKRLTVGLDVCLDAFIYAVFYFRVCWRAVVLSDDLWHFRLLLSMALDTEGMLSFIAYLDRRLPPT